MLAKHICRGVACRSRTRRCAAGAGRCLREATHLLLRNSNRYFSRALHIGAGCRVVPGHALFMSACVRRHEGGRILLVWPYPMIAVEWAISSDQSQGSREEERQREKRVYQRAEAKGLKDKQLTFLPQIIQSGESRSLNYNQHIKTFLSEWFLGQIFELTSYFTHRILTFHQITQTWTYALLCLGNFVSPFYFAQATERLWAVHEGLGKRCCSTPMLKPRGGSGESTSWRTHTLSPYPSRKHAILYFAKNSNTWLPNLDKWRPISNTWQIQIHQIHDKCTMENPPLCMRIPSSAAGLTPNHPHIGVCRK